jgi:clan AA aspartic protease
MITGSIRETGTPMLAVKVMGRGGVEVALDGILDTGFDGFLCLPIPVAVSLGLELIDATDTELADGTIVEDDLVFAGKAEWDGTIMDIEILLTRAADVLIGTSLLKDYIVQLDYRANTVRIEKAPQR